MFANLRDPDYRSRRVFAFHRPETLHEWISQPDTLRARLQQLPPLITEGLWDAKVEAITNLEQSFAGNRPRPRLVSRRFRQYGQQKRRR